MNLQQVAEGVHHLLVTFPQLLNEHSNESISIYSDVEKALKAFSFNISFTKNNHSQSGKRKSPTLSTPESTPLNPHKKRALGDTSSIPIAHDIYVNSNETDEVKSKKPATYGQTFCLFIAQLLLESTYPIREYQYELTLTVVNTFRPILSNIVANFSQVAYTPVFPSVNFELDTLSYSKVINSNVSDNDQILAARQDSLISTLETFANIIQLEPKCVSTIFALLTRLPLPLHSMCPTNSNNLNDEVTSIRQYRFVRALFAILASHPSATQFINRHANEHWQTMLNLLENTDTQTRYFTSMVLSVFTELTAVDQSMFVKNAVDLFSSVKNTTTDESFALQVQQFNDYPSHASATMWANLLEVSVTDTLSEINKLHRTLANEMDIKSADLMSSSSSALTAWQENMCTTLMDYFTYQSTIDQQLKTKTGAAVFDKTQQTQEIVYLNDIIVPVRQGVTKNKNVSTSNKYVKVESSDASVKSFAMALNEARPILLEGPAGAGKSLLIDHVAHLTHNHDYLRIYMDDQMDSKTLLGTQTCTDIPGEFVWRPGALTQALTQGKWVVLEDIHRAQFEVLASLIPLFEKNVLLVPGRAEVITAAPGFRLIVTWTTGSSSLSPVFLKDYLANRSNTVISVKSDDCTLLKNEPNSPQILQQTPSASLSQLSSQASNASSPAHVLLHRLFSRILLPNVTIPDIHKILINKTDKLRTVVGMIDAVIKTSRCFAVPATIEEIVGAAAALVAGKEEDQFGSEDDSDDEMKDAKITKPTVSFNTNSPSPFGAACTVTLRHVYRFADRVERIINEIPTIPIKNSSDDDVDSCQIELTPQISLDIVRAALDCFTAAAVPTKSEHTLSRRKQIIAAISSIWQVQPHQIESTMSVYKPNVVINDHEVRINQFSLNRNKNKSNQLLNDPHMAKFSLTRHALLNMEKIFAGIVSADPLLLVGETGNGKTTIVQYLAAQLGQVLHVHNMNQQSESSDLLGGFKPVELRVACLPLMNQFGMIFPKTFSREANKDFLVQVKKAFDDKNWKLLVHFFRQTLKNVQTKLSLKSGKELKQQLKDKWVKFSNEVTVFERRIQQTSSFAFWFAEGSLINAIRDGHWILLDEVNLASAETLDRLASLLEDKHGSIALTERGDVEVVQRHPNFRIFACMNPATDAGKKDLPIHIRDRFCELYINDIDEEQDLHLIISEALGAETSTSLNVSHLVHWFLHVKALCKTVLFDGAQHHPHYSPRSLVRALRFAKRHAGHYGTYRALYEGICLSFSSPLSSESRLLVDALLWQHIFIHIYNNAIGNKIPVNSVTRGSVPSLDVQLEGRTKLLGLLNQYTVKSLPKALQSGHIVIGPHAIQPGPHPIIEAAKETFIITPTVEARLGDVARGIVSKLPVLLQGPTSAGKTSLVTYLADVTGNKCVRINNHLHTDVQEYIGSYVTDSEGNLAFQEGILVTAVRNGYWIILDELNLAPSEVLESLNRLLDDNNEIFIAETQETVRAHPNFLLFATQNPPGLYGGRKVLSRAFTNRFVQLHCDDLPEEELITILERRCKIPSSYAQKMVAIMKDLQMRRQSSLAGGVFAGKKAMLTPRDLFRWADRKPTTYKKLAEDGFLLLGERLRNEEGKLVVKEILEKHCNCTIDLVEIYTSDDIPVLDESGNTKKSDRENEMSKKEREEEERLSKLEGGGKALRKQRKAEKLKKKAAALEKTDDEEMGDVEEVIELSAEELEMERIVKEEMEKIGSVAWTFSMRRLFTLVYRCVQHNEPVLLVGATGAGKTTVCQILAIVLRRRLDIINCHQHTETSDFLGGLRPVRGKDRILSNLISAINNLVNDITPMVTASEALALAFNEVTMSEMGEADLTMANLLLTSVQTMFSTFPQIPALPDTEDLTPQQASTVLIPWIEQVKSASTKTIKNVNRAIKCVDAITARKIVEDNRPSLDEYNTATTHLGVEDASSLSSFVDLAFSFDKILSEVQPLLQSFNALFEWKDGVLVNAMKQGSILLLDEISLADDAVLERLNSVLESTRTLFLAEKGGDQVESIVAHPKFAIVATMNPGGDFGKKELSPALRNRFTEVWVPQLEAREDLLNIITERFLQPIKKMKKEAVVDKELIEIQSTLVSAFADEYSSLLLDFITYFNGLKLHRRQFSLRDILAWVGFMTHLFIQELPNITPLPVVTNEAVAKHMEHCYINAASLVILDGLAVGADDGDSDTSIAKTQGCIEYLVSQLPDSSRESAIATLTYNATESMVPRYVSSEDTRDAEKYPHGTFGIDPFYIGCGAESIPSSLPFASEATSTRINLTRVLRALQLPRAVLLEGSPGVGKTSLIAALAKMAGHRLVRINLSEQTDMLDLLGSDLPVHGGEGGQFVWCDGVFLQALKAGDWVLLDELNLASQSVLEGLNAVLDHRAQIYLPELDQTFNCPPSFRLFAAQNPVAQGGGRKGLPASFLNRFTKVWLHAMTTEDLHNIAIKLYPDIRPDYLSLMIEFNKQVHRDTMVDRTYGRVGAPWEFNLRDVFRWCDLVRNSARDITCILDTTVPTDPLLTTVDDVRTFTDESGFGLGNALMHPGAFLDIMYLQRMRTETDRLALQLRFDEICKQQQKIHQGIVPYSRHDNIPSVEITPSVFRIGNAWVPRLPQRTTIEQEGVSFQTMSMSGIKALANTMLGSSSNENCLLLYQLLRPLEHLTRCVSRAWPVILVGEAGTGKTSLVRMLAKATNNELHEIAMSSSADSTDLLGCFEQVDWDRHRATVLEHASELASYLTSSLLIDIPQLPKDSEHVQYFKKIVTQWAEFQKLNNIELLSGKVDDSLSDIEKLQKSQQAVNIAPCFRDNTFEALIEFYTIAESACAFVNTQVHELPTKCSNIISCLELPTHLNPVTLRTEAETFQHNTTSAKLAVGRFEWMDGTLLRALERGHWIVLDNSNFCNPTVLDRLNGLLEPNGTLLVNECGLVNGEPRIVSPHPNFRIFLTLDPQFNEISRAMRNRCVEITLTHPVGSSDIASRAHRMLLGLTIAETPVGKEKLLTDISSIFDAKSLIPRAETTLKPTVEIEVTQDTLYNELISSNTKNGDTNCEIVVENADTLSINDVFSVSALRDLIAITSTRGVPGIAINSFLAQIHTAMLMYPALLSSSSHITSHQYAVDGVPAPSVTANSRHKVWNIRNLTRWASLLVALINQNSELAAEKGISMDSLRDLLWKSFFHTYTLSRFAGHTSMQLFVSKMFTFFFMQTIVNVGPQLVHSQKPNIDALFLAPAIFPQNISTMATVTFPLSCTLLALRRQLAIVDYIVNLTISNCSEHKLQRGCKTVLGEVFKTHNLKAKASIDTGMDDLDINGTDASLKPVEDMIIDKFLAIPYSLYSPLKNSLNNDANMSPAPLTIGAVLSSSLERFISLASPVDASLRIRALENILSVIDVATKNLSTVSMYVAILRSLKRHIVGAQHVIQSLFNYTSDKSPLAFISTCFVKMREGLASFTGIDSTYISQQPLNLSEVPSISPANAVTDAPASSVLALIQARIKSMKSFAKNNISAQLADESYQAMLMLQHVLTYYIQINNRRALENSIEDDMLSHLSSLGTPIPTNIRNNLYPLALSFASAKHIIPVHNIDNLPFCVSVYPAMLSFHDSMAAVLTFIATNVIAMPSLLSAPVAAQRTMSIVLQVYLIHRLRVQMYDALWSAHTATGSLSSSPYEWNYGSILIRWRVITSTFNLLLRSLRQYCHDLPVDAPKTEDVLTKLDWLSKEKLISQLESTDNALIRASQSLMTQSGGNSDLHMLVGQPPLGRLQTLLVASGPVYDHLNHITNEINNALGVVCMTSQSVKSLRFFDSSVDPSSMVSSGSQNIYSTYTSLSSPFQNTSTLWLPPHLHWTLPVKMKEAIIELVTNSIFVRSPLLFRIVAKTIASQMMVEEGATDTASLLASVMGRKRTMVESRAVREQKFVRAFLVTMASTPIKLRERMIKYLVTAVVTKQTIMHGKTQANSAVHVPEHAFLTPLEDATLVHIWTAFNNRLRNVLAVCELILQRPSYASNDGVKKALDTSIFKALKIAHQMMQFIGMAAPISATVTNATLYSSLNHDVDRSRCRTSLSPCDIAYVKTVINMLSTLDVEEETDIPTGMDGINDDYVVSFQSAVSVLDSRLNEFMWNNSLVAPLLTRYKIDREGNLSSSTYSEDDLKKLLPTTTTNLDGTVSLVSDASETSLDHSLINNLINDTEQRSVFPQFTGLGSAAMNMAIHVLAFKNLPNRANNTAISKRNIRISQLSSVVDHLLMATTSISAVDNEVDPLSTIFNSTNESKFTLSHPSTIDVLTQVSNIIVKVLPAFTTEARAVISTFASELILIAANVPTSITPKDTILSAFKTSSHPLFESMIDLVQSLLETIYTHYIVDVSIAKTINTNSTSAWVSMGFLLVGLINLRLAVPVAPVDPSQVSKHQGLQANDIANKIRTQLSIRKWGMDVQSSAVSTDITTETSVISHVLGIQPVQLFPDNFESNTSDKSSITTTGPSSKYMVETSDNATMTTVMVGQTNRSANLFKQLTFRSQQSKSFSTLFELLHKFTNNAVAPARTIQLAHAMTSFITTAPAQFAQASETIDENGNNNVHVPIQNAHQMLREESMLQDLTISFLQGLRNEFKTEYLDICVGVESAVYTIKTALRDMAALVSASTSAQTLALAHSNVLVNPDSLIPANEVVVMPESTRVISGTLYSLLAFPYPMLPSTLAPEPGQSENKDIDMLADPLLYLLSGRVTASLQSLGEVASNINKAKTRMANEKKREKERERELEQAELRRRTGDAYGEDVMDSNVFGENDDVDDWNVETGEGGMRQKQFDSLASTEIGGDDGFDGIASDDEDDDSITPVTTDYTQLPLLVYRATLLRFLVTALTSSSGPISHKVTTTRANTNTSQQSVAVMNPKIARLVTLIFNRVLGSYRKKLLLAQIQADAEAEVFKLKNNEVDILTEEEQLEYELKMMYPDFTDTYSDLVKMNDEFNNDDINGDDDRKKEAAFEMMRAQEELAKITVMVDEDVTSTFLAFKLLFACAQSNISVGDIAACNDAKQLSDAVTTLRSLAISASQSAATMMISALEITQASHALCTKELESLAFPGLLYTMSTAYLYLAQHASLSGVAHDLANANASAATSAAMSIACAGDIVVTLGGLCAVLCPALSPMPPVDTSNKMLSWKKMNVENENARAGTEHDVKLIYHDVWRQPNMAEVQRLVQPLRNYQNRIRYLLTLFPSHPILRQLALLAARLAAQPLNSPIMKILTGCEYLLKKSEEWESYAHKRVKLKDELFQLTILVARWRKLELHSWPMVLKRADDTYETSAIPWWCKLYPVVHCSPQDLATYNVVASDKKQNSANSKTGKNTPDDYNAKNNAYDNYFLQLHTALQEFIVYSNLGEIKARLAILLGFRNQIDREIRGGYAAIAYEEGIRLPVSIRIQVSNLLEHVFRQYVQFLPAVMKHLADEKLPLERTIVEQVKLSVWDLSNYWSLKDSTDKSHRRVHKLAHDYEVLLKTPFSAVLQKVAAEDVSHASGVGVPNMGGVYKMYVSAKQAAKAWAARVRRVAGKTEKKKKKKEPKVRVISAHEVADEEGNLLEQTKNDEDDDDEEAMFTTAVALSQRTCNDVTRFIHDAEVTTHATVPGFDAAATLNLGGASIMLKHITGTQFIAPVSTWVPYIASFSTENSDSIQTSDMDVQLPMYFARMITLLRRSLLSAKNNAQDASALNLLDEMTIATIQRVENLTQTDTVNIQTKKMAVTDTIKLLRLLGLSFHSSASGMLALAENATIGSLQVSQMQDMDVFSASALPDQPGQSKGIEGDDKSNQHDIHTASLSLLSASASARGIHNLDSKDDNLLNIISSSFQEMNENADELFDTEDLGNQAVFDEDGEEVLVRSNKPKKVFRALTSTGQNLTRVVQLPLWFLNSSLSASFPQDSLTTVPQLLTNTISNDKDNIPLISNPAPVSLSDLIVSLSNQCDSSVHDTFTGIRKMRTRVSTSAQKDVNRGQIVKIQGMLEHLFTLSSTSLAHIADVSTPMHLLRQWLFSMNIFAKTNVDTIFKNNLTTCSLEQLAVIVSGLLECVEAEFVLLQRIQTVIRHNTAACNVVSRRMNLLSDTAIFPKTIPNDSTDMATLSRAAAGELQLPVGPLPALRALHKQISNLLSFLNPEHISHTDSNHVWTNMISHNVRICTTQVLMSLPAIIGVDKSQSNSVLSISSLSSHPLIGKVVKTVRARMGLPNPISPWNTLCAEAWHYVQTTIHPVVPKKTKKTVNLPTNVSEEYTNDIINKTTNSILVLIQEVYHATTRKLNDAKKPEEKKQTETEESSDLIESDVESLENLVLNQLEQTESRLQKKALTRVLSRFATISNYHNNIVMAHQKAVENNEDTQFYSTQLSKLSHAMSLLTPFLHQLYVMYTRQIILSLGISRGSMRLLQVLLSVFNVILVKGLCKRPDEQDGDDDQGEDGPTESGTGMGEGSGGKDVSDEIVDEQQLLGTKNERTDDTPKDQEEQDTDTGVDMTNDFDGDMVDMPENQDQDDKDKQEEEHEREMGELDDDDEQNVVDEKLWNPEEDNDEDIDRSKEKKEDSQVEGSEDNTETVAGNEEDQPDNKNKDKDKKEDKKDEKKDEKKEEPKVDEAADDDQEESNEDLGQVNMDDPDRDEEDNGIAPADMPDDIMPDDDPMEDEIPQEEAEDDKEEGENEGEKDEEGQGEGEVELEEKGSLESDMNDAEDQDSTEKEDGEEMEMEDPDEEAEEEGETQDEESMADQEDRPDDEYEQPQDDSVAALDSLDQEEEDEMNDEEVNREDNAAESAAQQAPQEADADMGQLGGQDVQGNDQEKRSKQSQSQQQEQQQQDQQDNEDNEESNDSQNDTQQSSSGEMSEYNSPQDQKVQGNVPPQSKKEQKEQSKAQKIDNPYASLGDALKQWRERLDIMESEDAEETRANEDAGDDAPEQDVADNFDDNTEDLGGKVEHAKKNEAAEMQVLAAVDENDDETMLPKLPEDKVEDGKQEGEAEIDAEGETDNMDDDENKNNEIEKGGDGDESDDEDNEGSNESDSKKKSKKRGDSTLKRNTEDEEEEEEEDTTHLDELIEEFNDWYDPYKNDEAAATGESSVYTGDLGDELKNDDAQDDDEARQELSAEQIQEMRDEFDRDFDMFNSGTERNEMGLSRVDHASKLWQTLTTITSDLSQQLCEQLRIILEPSLASKLAGDYRTGKRINIKKIIPFIASQFRRDKIWLRRTAPNKRNYQVLIAIDDSGSMKSNNAGRLALEALSVLCQSLTQLEVGEISVVRFGDEPKLLHPFSKPFTPETGAYVVSGFEFNQKQTHWVSMLQRITTLLDHAREGNNSGSDDKENVQLVFIVSDARVQQDREYVAKLAREALEKKQLLCLLIIDTDDDSKSIISIKKVETIKGGLKVSNYLDNFPFPYYTIIRDIQALPEVIAEALREWFQMVQRAD